MSTTQALTAKDGSLYLGEAILLVRYPAGDCDTINWPNPNRGNLACALFDACEMGELPSDCRAVTLPDGTSFEIESEMPESEPYQWH